MCLYPVFFKTIFLTNVTFVFLKERLFSGSFFQRGLHTGGTSGIEMEIRLCNCCCCFPGGTRRAGLTIEFGSYQVFTLGRNESYLLASVPLSGGHHRYAIRSFAPHGGRGSWGVWGNSNRGAAGPAGTQQTAGAQTAGASSAVRLRGRQILDHEALTCLLVRV